MKNSRESCLNNMAKKIVLILACGHTRQYDANADRLAAESWCAGCKKYVNVVDRQNA